MSTCTAETVSSVINSHNASSLVNLPYLNPALYCYCNTLGWSTMSYATLVTPPTPIQIATQGLLPASSCPFQSCPRWFSFDVQGVWGQSFCLDWVTNRGVVIGLNVGAALVVLTINILLGFIMRALTVYEGHTSVDSMNSSLALRMFVACFANTALLVVLINVSWPKLPGAAATADFLEPGKYSDFSNGWYNNVGVALMSTMLINMVAPHAYPVFAGCMYCRKMGDPELTAPTQRDLNTKLLGPHDNTALRYAQLYNTVFVCFSFATGMPLMMPILAASVLLFYWVDKGTFMWYYRTPKTSGTLMQATMSNLMPIALVLHLGIGVWQLSAVPNLQQVANGVTAYKSLNTVTQPWVTRVTVWSSTLDNPLLSMGLQRVTQAGVLPLLIMFLVIIAALVLQFLAKALGRAICTAFNVLTCNCVGERCRSRNTEPWRFDQPTYSWATDHANKGHPYAMQGTPSYNILLNADIMQAFAIPKSFALTHKRCAFFFLPPFLLGSSVRLSMQLFSYPPSSPYPLPPLLSLSD